MLNLGEAYAGTSAENKKPELLRFLTRERVSRCLRQALTLPPFPSWQRVRGPVEGGEGDVLASLHPPESACAE